MKLLSQGISGKVTHHLLTQAVWIILALAAGCSQNIEQTSVVFSDDFSAVNPAHWQAVSGAWVQINGEYQQRTVGDSYEIVPDNPSAGFEPKDSQTLFFDNFNSNTTSNQLWANKRGVFIIENDRYITKGSDIALSIPSDKKFMQWSDYRIQASIACKKAPGDFGAAILYFRLTMANKEDDNSYALLFRRRGILDLYKKIDGKFGDRLASVAIPENKEAYNVIALVVGSEIKIWLDKTEDQIPDIIVHDRSFPSGTIGLGAYGGMFEFDDIEVLPVLKAEAWPPHFYQDGKTTLRFSSSLDFESIQVSIVSPSGKIYGPIYPSDCLGQSSCSATFPDAFSMNLNELGTYKVTVNDRQNSTILLLEVREKPLFSFMVLSDTHYRDHHDQDLQDLRDFVSDTNKSRHFPLPAFVVITGDLTDSGTTDEMRIVKDAFDQLLIPYYPILGNHDWVEDLRRKTPKGKHWSDVFGADKRFYGWSYGDFLFLTEDSSVTYGSKKNDPDFLNYTKWLRHQLASNKNKRVILFCHYGHTRIRDDGDAFSYWWGGGNSNDVKDILEASGRVVAEFAGHSHVSGLKKSDNIYYVHTTGFNNMGEYRYVEIYKNHMEVHAVQKSSYRWDLAEAYWQGSADSTHNTKLYSFGLPIERQFKIDYGAKTIDFLDAISVSRNSNWRDYMFQADIKLGKELLVGDNVAGLVFHYHDPNNYYAVLLDKSRREIKLQKKQKGVVADLGSERTLVQQDKVYQLRIVTKGNEIQVYLNDVLKIKATDSAFSSGKIGFKSYRAHTFYDNVVVKK